MAYRRSALSAEDAAAGLAGGALAIAVVLLLLCAYWAFRAGWLVIRMFARYPRSRALWWALGLCLGAWGLFGVTLAVTGGVTPSRAPLAPVVSAALALAVLATVALPVMAKIVEIRADHLFQRELGAETLVHDVLQRPWWEAA